MKRNFENMEGAAFDFKKMDKIVHIDLKGAPLRMEYLLKVIHVSKNYGATGVLLEWEDTFPYTGELAVIGSNGPSNTEGMYTMEEVKHIIQTFSSKDFKVIQLVQTMGHMEFVLKHPQFKELREAPHSPSAICPLKEKAQQLVKMMIDQILDAQPDAEFLHIGADEVWFMAKCDACRAHSRDAMFGKYSLFLRHVRAMALHARRRRPGLSVLLWDDMLRPMTEQALHTFELPSLVTPVVWYYGPGGLERGLGGGVPAHAWQLYARAFPALWAASAYKGANGSSKMMSTTCRYVSNQKYWVQQIQRREQQFHFHGVILTGWSRYDHFATLCEILPVSMGSLAACLHVYQQTPGPAPTGDEINVFHAELISRLHEGGTVEEIVGERPVVENISAELPRLDSWPFEDAARAVAKFSCLRDQACSVVRGDGYGVHSWLNPWHVERGYTNPAQLQSMAEDTGLILSRLLQTKESIESQLAPILGKRSFEEWMATFVQPIVEQMTTLHEQADAAVKREPGVVPAIMQ